LEELEEYLRQQLRGRVREVRAVWRDGKVVVHGTALSYYAKQLAQHLALPLLEGAPFVNELEVRRRAPEPESGAG
jgi:hypothetical protein